MESSIRLGLDRERLPARHDAASGKAGAMMERRKLSDILRNGERDAIASAWQSTQAAGELTPLPPGEYIAHVISGDLFTARTNGTAGYKLTFQVCEGPHQGRRFWHDLWLTPAALPMTKRDLAKIGVTAMEQLEAPIPQGIRCKVKLALRKDDDGTEYNRVRSFEVVGIDRAEPDAFAPADFDPAPDAGDRAAQAEPDLTALQDQAAQEPPGDASFAFGHNVGGAP